MKEIEGDRIFIEDSGLFVEALGGFPGVYSAYVSKTIGFNGVLRLMKGEENRKAYFKSIVCLKLKGEIKIFRGEVEGRIAEKARGKGGFGYDPIFIPKGSEKTFAEAPEIKNIVSHRKSAIEDMRDFLEYNLK